MKSRIMGWIAQAAMGLALLAPLPSLAVVVYEFSLAANGEVGPVEIRWTRPAFEPVGDLLVTPLTDPSIAFTSGTTLTAGSVIGFDQDATATLWGLALFGSSGFVLFTDLYPADFFAFLRDFDDEGVFTSVSGLVTSSLALADTTPIATLCVSQTGACDQAPVGVPAPAPLVLVALGLAALGLSRRTWRASRNPQQARAAGFR